MSDDMKGLIGSIVIIYAIVFSIVTLMGHVPTYFHLGSFGLVVGGIGLSIRRKWGIYVIIVSMGLHLFYALSGFHIRFGIFNPLLIFQLFIIIWAVMALKK